jgi:hypothetical protein
LPYGLQVKNNTCSSYQAFENSEGDRVAGFSFTFHLYVRPIRNGTGKTAKSDFSYIELKEKELHGA